MKSYYDKDSVMRGFQKGDQVLIFFPVPRKPLQAKYSGPFEIERKIDNTNHVVRTPDCKKDSQICHINMLKEYYKRDKTVLLARYTNQDHSSKDIKDIPDHSEAKLQNSNVL